MIVYFEIISPLTFFEHRKIILSPDNQYFDIIINSCY